MDSKLYDALKYYALHASCILLQVIGNVLINDIHFLLCVSNFFDVIYV